MFQDEPSVGSTPYNVQLIDQNVISTEGNMMYGSSIFTANLVAVTPSPESPITEEVVCKETHQMARDKIT